MVSSSMESFALVWESLRGTVMIVEHQSQSTMSPSQMMGFTHYLQPNNPAFSHSRRRMIPASLFCASLETQLHKGCLLRPVRSIALGIH